jgi:hypothetical protein
VKPIAPARFVPRIFTASPTLPEAGSASTNGPRQTDRLKTVPAKTAPPPLGLATGVVPWKLPFVSGSAQRWSDSRPRYRSCAERSKYHWA